MIDPLITRTALTSNLNHRAFALSYRASPTHKPCMPIAREHRWLYPMDWRELSVLVRFDRARGECEHCRRPRARRAARGNGTWWDEATAHGRDDWGREVRRLPALAGFARIQPGFPGIGAPAMLASTHVVLASAHLNHDPGDNRLRNLAARCHMRHNAREHRRRNAFRLKAARDLFV